MDDTLSYVAIIIATASAGFAFWQTKEFVKQTKLAFLPSLTPRYSNPDERYVSYLLISNVGQGSAVDVKLAITDLENNASTPFSRFAIQPQEERTTGIPLRDNSRWKITGTYVDTSGKIHNVEIEFEYPPKITKFKQ